MTSYKPCASPLPCYPTGCVSPVHISCCDLQCRIKELDQEISQLKATIFELDQHSKDLECLKMRLAQLQDEFNSLNDLKCHLECEMKAHEDDFNQRLSCLVAENNTLTCNYNDKLAHNSSLFSENDCLSKQVEMKNAEICCLNNKIADITNQLNCALNEKANLERNVQDLTNIKDHQCMEIAKLFDDNKQLSRVCTDQEHALQVGENERLNMAKEVENKNCQIAEMDNKIRCLGNSICLVQKELDDANNCNCQLKARAHDLECSCSNLNASNDELKRNICNEQSIRQKLECENANLTNLVNDRDNCICNLNRDFDNEKCLNQQVNDENAMFRVENDKLRNHAKVLTCQNEKLTGELAHVVDQDEQMTNVLARKDQVAALLRNNHCELAQSLNELQRCCSPPCSPKCCPPPFC